MTVWLKWKTESGRNPLPIYDGRATNTQQTITISHTEANAPTGEHEYNEIKVSVYKQPHFKLAKGEERTVTTEHLIVGDEQKNYAPGGDHNNQGKYLIHP